jgi:regulator of CtrA degradation
MCHIAVMGNDGTQIRLRGRLIDALYTEAMVLADEARAYFEHHSKADRERLDSFARVIFSCESLKVTTRLMHVLSWLLVQRAIEYGQIDEEGARSSQERIGVAADSDMPSLALLPDGAIALIESSRDLYARVCRLEAADTPAPAAASPALGLLNRLERAF